MGRATVVAIEFRLLGPMELRINGDTIELGTAKQRAVLAVLLTAEGRPVTIDALVDRVWGDEPPDQVRKTVYSYMSRLRGLFRGHTATPLIRAGGGGYVLDVPPEAVDMHRFRRFAERAREPATAEHVRRDLFCEALNQWRGTPLTGLAGTWAERVRHGLEQQRINAAAEWAALELRLGPPEPVIDRLYALLADHPLAEVLSGQLIRALHRAGRNAEAVAHYGMVRRRIMAELGVHPSQALRAIYREIQQESTRAEPPEPVWAGLRPHLTRLFGRTEESARLSGLLDTARLVTVTGVGGCGKSALALAVAADFTRRRRRPVLALALATVTSAEQALHTLAALLSASDTGDARHAVEQILNTGPRLLVLDNCEHLAAGIADLVSGLLHGCTELQVLATSRQPLGVPGETVFALEPLPVPPRSDGPTSSVLTAPAVELFVERIHQAAPSVTIDDAAADHVAELCRRLDGLPLALELVAARARTFPLAELVERVGHDLTLLFHTSRDDDSRHATMDATLDWSFRLLSASQRTLFARMSVFAGGFTTADVQAVCEFAPLAPGTVPALLAALVDRSLVQPYDVDGGRRYRLLNVIRTYAGTRLAESGEHTTTASHHLGRWLALAREIDRLPRYDQRVLRWRGLAVDVANLRQSLEYGFRGPETGLDAAEIIAKTFEFWLVNKGYLLEGRTWLQRALSLRELTKRPEVHALLRFHHALLVKMSGDNLGGMALMRPVVADLACRRPREHLEAQACVLSAKMTALDPSVLDDVEPVLATALASPEDDDVLTVVNAAGTVLNTWGRYDRVLDLYAGYDRRGVVLARSSTAAKLAVKITAVLGTGDLTTARALTDELVALLDAITHAAEHSAPRRVIALGYLVGDKPGRARRFLDDALGSLHAAQAPLSSRFVHLQILLAEAQRRCGDVTTATRTLRNALATAVSTDFQQSFSATLCAALLAADLGDDGAGRRLAWHWDTVRREHGLPVPVGFAAAAETLGLDPAPPREPAGRWNRTALASCVDSARHWCARQP